MKFEGQNFKKFGLESGQTLIETIVALGLLTTGIVGGLSLAIFALNASDVTLKQIVATNLAREGIEIARNFRDTNWLNDSLTDCSSYMGTDQQCYADWHDEEEDISGGIFGYFGINRRVRFFPNTNSWDVNPNNNINQAAVYLQADGTYTSSGSGTPAYYRRIRITREIGSPFNLLNFRIRIESTVWWHGRRCTTITNIDNINTPCKVEVVDYLTNWKNY